MRSIKSRRPPRAIEDAARNEKRSMRAVGTKKGAALRKVAEGSRAIAAIPCYQDDARALNALIDTELSTAGLRITPAARELLVESLGGDRIASSNEIRKLLLYCLHDSVIDEQQVTEIIGDASAISTDEVVDAVEYEQEGGVVLVDGLLRPLDLILPYRLEMGIRLDNPRGKDLYAFWGDRITEAVDTALRKAKSTAVINLASMEYFKSVKVKKLSVPAIQPVFEDWSAGRYKVVSFYAKRARGLMARFAVRRRIGDPSELKDFAEEGYVFDEGASDAARWVFRRKLK